MSNKVKYKKPQLDFETQADRLMEKGLEADKQELISFLKYVNYYRLKGYLFPFFDKNKQLKLEENSKIPKKAIGMPENWRQSQIWNM